MSSSSYKYYLPTRILFNEKRFQDFSPFLKSADKTFLVISQSLHNKRPEIAATIPGAVEIFSEVGSNPTLQQLEKIHIPSSCTQVIGIGGGSKLDAAKAIFAKIITGGNTSLNRLIESPELIDACLSNRHKFNFILVPTTFGSSSEITRWSTIWDRLEMKKYSISSEALYADTALIFPELSLTAPRDITAYTALDTLSHAVEALWNKNKNSLTVNRSLESIEICIKTLPKLLRNLNSVNNRIDMAKASILAGLAFSQTRTAAAHALSYPLTLFHGIPHGYACSLTLGVMFKYNYSQEPSDLGKVLAIFQKYYGNQQSSFQECFANFLQACKVPSTLSEFGVQDSDISQLVAQAFHPDRFKNMIYTLSENQVRKIYQAIL